MATSTVAEYRSVDKSQWGNGPWKSEPDKVHFVDEATGLDCLALRHSRMGFLCGYVALEPGHPWFDLSYDDIPAKVHGGLTFGAERCAEGHPPERGICHVPRPGQPADVHWIGFDCAHAWDYSPGTDPALRGDETYRTLEFVKAQCSWLAAQVAAA